MAFFSSDDCLTTFILNSCHEPYFVCQNFCCLIDSFEMICYEIIYKFFIDTYYTLGSKGPKIMEIQDRKDQPKISITPSLHLLSLYGNGAHRDVIWIFSTNGYWLKSVRYITIRGASLYDFNFRESWFMIFSYLRSMVSTMFSIYIYNKIANQIAIWNGNFLLYESQDSSHFLNITHNAFSTLC